MNRLVLFITEGKSEENALYSIMKSYFRPDPVIFHIYHGDPPRSRAMRCASTD